NGLEVAIEVLPAALVELALLALGVHHPELLELVGEQQRLQLRVALDVDLVRAVLHLVERRLRDLDEALLYQLTHLAEEQGEDERSWGGARDAWRRHHNDL